MSNGKYRQEILDELPEDISSDERSCIDTVIDHIEAAAQEIRDKLDDIKSIDDLHYVNDARELADQLKSDLY